MLEEFLEGEELSLLALCDGEHVVPLAPAQDYKRIFDGDEGPNTGGMGSYSPVPGLRRRRASRRSSTRSTSPIVDELRRRGTPFHGVLYAGLMMTADGPQGARVQRPLRRPRDPGGAAAAALRPARALLAAREPGGLGGRRAEFGERLGGDASCSPRAGYPESSSKGDVITRPRRGRRRASRSPTPAPPSADGEIVTAGGRVLNVTGARRRPRPRRASAPTRRPSDRVRRQADAHRHRARAVERVGLRSRAMESGDRAEYRARPAPRPARPMPEVEAAFEEIEVDAPRVGIIMGSKNDMPKMEPAGKELEERGHPLRGPRDERPPRPGDGRATTAKNARMRGLRVIIAGAGLSAALPGVVAAHTDLPVIGVPLTRRHRSSAASTRCSSVAQMPPGRPGRLRRRRQRQERRPCSRRASSDGVIERYTRPEMGAVWIRAGASWTTWLAGRAGRGRGAGRARAWSRPRTPPALPRAGRVHGRGGEGARAGHRPRRRRVRRRASPARSASAGRWIHYGLTSSDVLDTALGLQLARGRRRSSSAARATTATRSSRGRASTRDTLCVGRTHGVHAEPTTFGLQARRLRLRGATATSSGCERAFEQARGRRALRRGRHLRRRSARESRRACWSGSACAREDVSTQVVPRDRHAELLERDRARRRRARALRDRGPPPAAHRGARGRGAVRAGRRRARRRCRTSATRSSPSASPASRGVLRGYAQAGLENVALWHERDISHSSAPSA